MFPSPGVPPSNCAGETLRCKDGTGLGHHGQARSQYQDPVAEPGPLGKTGRDSVFLPRALPALMPSHPHSAGQGPFWRLPHPGGGTHRAGLQWPPCGSLTTSAECAVVRVARSQETLQSTKNARFSSAVSCPRAVCRRVSIRRHTGFEDPCHVDQEPHVPRYPKSQSGTDLPQESTTSRGSCARPVPVTMTLPVCLSTCVSRAREGKVDGPACLSLIWRPLCRELVQLLVAKQIRSHLGFAGQRPRPRSPAATHEP